jgi:hypothetical protein
MDIRKGGNKMNKKMTREELEKRIKNNRRLERKELRSNCPNMGRPGRKTQI